MQLQTQRVLRSTGTRKPENVGEPYQLTKFGSRKIPKVTQPMRTEMNEIHLKGNSSFSLLVSLNFAFLCTIMTIEINQV